MDRGLITSTNEAPFAEDSPSRRRTKERIPSSSAHWRHHEDLARPIDVRASDVAPFHEFESDSTTLLSRAGSSVPLRHPFHAEKSLTATWESAASWRKVGIELPFRAAGIESQA